MVIWKFEQFLVYDCVIVIGWPAPKPSSVLDLSM